MKENNLLDATPQEPALNPLVKKILITASIVIVLSIPLVILFSSAPKPKKTLSVEKEQTNIAALEQLATSNPTSANIIALSVAYINNGMPGKAIKPLQNLIKKEPNNASAYNNLGVANILLKNYQTGIDACTKAIRLDTGFQLAKNNLRWGLDEKNKALTTIEALEKLTPDKQDKAYFIQLGLLYMQTGNYAKSIQIWQKGLQKYKDSEAVFYNNIGTSMVLNKEYDEAIKMFNKVLAIEPNNQLAKNNIIWAEQEKKDNTPQ
ncbi:MAG: tetratricopeptide repeat protein [Sphingobacteriales bacterium]|uniref:tetratricopeptide repeat protein n=1 Tax=Hydrotalea flava TaxID=714549 RepID=UPI00083295F9|nr:tetratricopeptide repeat protein [Hydrotalea flava]RTL51088.1 MAG: tetratricopeptide repeat protein [Sphingobacteriales bacterium]